MFLHSLKAKATGVLEITFKTDCLTLHLWIILSIQINQFEACFRTNPMDFVSNNWISACSGFIWYPSDMMIGDQTNLLSYLNLYQRSKLKFHSKTEFKILYGVRFYTTTAPLTFFNTLLHMFSLIDSCQLNEKGHSRFQNPSLQITFIWIYWNEC